MNTDKIADIKKGNKTSGTLILAVSYRDGVILAGDKGGHGGIEKADEQELKDQEKVIQLSDKILMAVCGHVFISDPDDHSIYEVHSINITRDYFNNNEFDNSDKFWQGLIEVIFKAYGDYVEKYKDFDPMSLELPFIYEDQGRLQMRVLIMEFDGKEFIFDPDRIREHWFQGLFAYWGYAYLLDDLLHEPHKHKNLLKHSSIRAFLDKKNSVDDISEVDAIKFIRKIMKESSERKPSKEHVSAEFNHIALRVKPNFIPLS